MPLIERTPLLRGGLDSRKMCGHIAGADLVAVFTAKERSGFNDHRGLASNRRMTRCGVEVMWSSCPQMGHADFEAMPDSDPTMTLERSKFAIVRESSTRASANARCRAHNNRVSGRLLAAALRINSRALASSTPQSAHADPLRALKSSAKSCVQRLNKAISSIRLALPGKPEIKKIPAQVLPAAGVIGLVGGCGGLHHRLHDTKINYRCQAAKTIASNF